MKTPLKARLRLFWQAWPLWPVLATGLVVLWLLDDKLIISVCWLTIGLIWALVTAKMLHTHTAREQTQQQINHAQIISGLREYGLQLRQIVHADTHETVSNIEQLQTLFSDSGQKLRVSFTGLQEKSSLQKSLLNEVLGNLRGDIQQDSVTFANFIEKTRAILQEYIDLVVRVSDKGIFATHKMQDMIEQINGMFSILSDVNKLTEQTNLLALNAAIEAARAGESGRGFAIVANEVRNLSQHSNQLNEKIRTQVNLVKSTLTQANDIVGEIASMDMKIAIESKGNMDEAIEVLNQTQKYIEEVLNKSSVIANNIRDDVSAAVTALQYEDIAHQLADYIIRKHTSFNAEIDQLAKTADDLDDSVLLLDTLNRELQQQYSTNREKILNPVASESLATGETELF